MAGTSTTGVAAFVSPSITRSTAPNNHIQISNAPLSKTSPLGNVLAGTTPNVARVSGGSSQSMPVASLRPGASVLDKVRFKMGTFLRAMPPGATSDPDDDEWFTDGLLGELPPNEQKPSGDSALSRGDQRSGNTAFPPPVSGVTPTAPGGDGEGVHLDVAARRALAETAAERPGEITTDHLLVTLLDLYPAKPLLKAGLTTDHIRAVADLPSKGVRLSSDLERLYSPGLESKPQPPVPDTETLLENVSHELKMILQTINVNPDAALSPTQLRDGILAFASAFPDSEIGSVMQAAAHKALHAARLDAVQRYMRENPGRETGAVGAGTQVPSLAQDPFAARAEDSEAVKEWRQLQSEIKPMETINSMCEDLTLRAADGLTDDIVGRDRELDQIAIALQEMKKGGALVVGQPGIGKTALVEALANKIVQGEYAGLKGYKVVSLPIGNLVADTQLRGALEEKVKNIINEAKDQKVVLFMDEFHTIVGAGKAQGESSDIANLFKPAKGVKIIGCTTEKEYSEKFKADAAFARRFELIKLAEPDRNTTQYILDTLVPKLEAHHNVTYTSDSVETAINLCDRFVPGHSPDKEITALDRTGAKARHHGESVVDAHMVTAGIEQSTGIPLKRLQESHGRSPQDIKQSLAEHVIGQEDAVEAVATSIFQARAGVNPNRPSVMVFSGPTGTGKTELAKAVAKVDGRHLIRIDMETVKNLSALKGAEPGFVGHERDGILTGPQALHPYSVVLFDEIEKAPDEVLKALLGLLDDGEMTNSRGERIPFNNAMIIFTTNFGADTASNGAKKPFGFDLGLPESGPTDERSEKRTKTQNVKDRLAERLGPEYINRFRNFVLFNELSEDNTRDITRLLLNDIAKELGTAKNMSFDFDERLVFMIGKNGHDPKSGAREVRRICDNIVRSAVGRAMLQWPELGDLDKKHHLDVAMTGPEMIEVTITTEGEGARLLKLPVSHDLRDIDLA